MSKSFRLFVSAAAAMIATTLAVVPAFGQTSTDGVVLKVSESVNIGSQVLTPGTYVVRPNFGNSVIAIENYANHAGSFALASTTSESILAGDRASVRVKKSSAGNSEITAIYFPAQNRTYYFTSAKSPRPETAAVNLQPGQ